MKTTKPQRKQRTLIEKTGIMTREQALACARRFYGNLGMVSASGPLKHSETGKLVTASRVLFVWKIGEFDRTVGRGMTWEQALHRARPGRKVEKEEEVA